MATKKVVKKVKGAVKPVLKKVVKPVLKKVVKPLPKQALKKAAQPAVKKVERYACAVCGLVVSIDHQCDCVEGHELICCEKVMKEK
jgi:hypothetical protein